jgi:hypothetical protein
MIKITVDEAYAFDYFSILEIKKKNGSNISNIIEIIENDLVSQIGLEKFRSIKESSEYKKLYISNQETFEAVDKAKNDYVKASYVDKCNYKRMICKKELQEKFFGQNLTEQKMGYEKLDFENE